VAPVNGSGGMQVRLFGSVCRTCTAHRSRAVWGIVILNVSMFVWNMVADTHSHTHTHTPTELLTQSVTPILRHSVTPSLNYSLFQSFSHFSKPSLPNSYRLSHSLTLLLPYSRSHLFTLSVIHLLFHSLTPAFPP